MSVRAGLQDGKSLEIPGLVGSVDVCALKLLIENEWNIKPADQRLVHKHHEVTGESEPESQVKVVSKARKGYKSARAKAAALPAIMSIIGPRGTHTYCDLNL